MSLINCKVKLRFTWKKYCVSSAAGADNVAGNVNDNLDGNNIFFAIKDTKIKQKVILKLHQMNLDILSNQILESIDYLYLFI